jgi:COP9 signalosome complex subunit 2
LSTNFVTFFFPFIDNHSTIMSDPFIQSHISGVLKRIRTQVLLSLITPYTRISLPFIAKELNIPEPDVEDLCVTLILDGRIMGKLDQIHRRLELRQNRELSNSSANATTTATTTATPVQRTLTSAQDRYNAMKNWAKSLDHVLRGVVAKGP